MSFDVLAPHYRWMEFFLAGEKLQRCRTAFLDRVSNARNVLILGEGHGRFLLECRERLPLAQITCVDSSARMIEVARNRLQRLGLDAETVTFVHADVLKWNPPRGQDLIVTHFLLDCFRPDQLQSLVARVAGTVRRDAAWLLADFQTPLQGLARLRACLILKAMYAFFRTVTKLPAKRLTPADPFLRHNGFHLRNRRVTEWGLLRSDYWTRQEMPQRN